MASHALVRSLFLIEAMLNALQVFVLVQYSAHDVTDAARDLDKIELIRKSVYIKLYWTSLIG